MKDYEKFLTLMAEEEFFKGFTWYVAADEGVGPYPVNATKDQLNEIINELEAAASGYLLLRNAQDTTVGSILVLPYETTDQISDWSLGLPTKCKEILDYVVVGH